MRCHREPLGRTSALKEMIEYMKGHEVELKSAVRENETKK
jgi:hypothetical protein